MTPPGLRAALRPACSPILRGRRIGLGTLALVLAVGTRMALTQEVKPVAELTRLHEEAGAAFVPSAVALAVYYLAETLVIVTLVGYGQRWGEATWGRPHLPWGGFALACTWGVAHVALQGPAGGVYAIGPEVVRGGHRPRLDPGAAVHYSAPRVPVPGDGPWLGSADDTCTADSRHDRPERSSPAHPARAVRGAARRADDLPRAWTPFRVPCTASRS